MSYVIVTDVFCDGKECGPEWMHGATGAKAERAEASKAARDSGWLVKGRKHYCPKCRQKAGEGETDG